MSTTHEQELEDAAFALLTALENFDVALDRVGESRLLSSVAYGSVVNSAEVALDMLGVR